MRNYRLLPVLCLVLFCGTSLAQTGTGNRFARVENGRFIVGESTPYYFVGTNMWYAPILGSEGAGGDRERLHRELDLLQSVGIDNLRILVGSDGSYGVVSKVEPILQPEPGAYDVQLLEGLDYLMAELGKREMFAVIYLTNAWEWSGGYCQYLEWTGRGTYPVPGVDGWSKYMEYSKQFHAVDDSDDAKIMFENHVRFIIDRTNVFTGLPYNEDPAIFSWQIANEPRAFANENKENFENWIGNIARLIKSLDPNHMVSTGSEGSMGSENDIELWRRIHSFPEIDYANIHAWPYNWSWVREHNMAENLQIAKDNVKRYIDEHVALMEPLGKPVVLEEFGFPRDGFVFTPGSPTTLRDSFYGYVFDLLEEDARNGGMFAGCNFWAWGGYAVPNGTHTWWSHGDDYTGDPAQEEQGLNSVFAGDSTLEIIKESNRKLNAISARGGQVARKVSINEIWSTLDSAAQRGKFLFGQQDFPFYGFMWDEGYGRADVRDVVDDYPAVLGCDLGEIELGGEKNLDGVPFSRMRDEIIAQYMRGGISTVSWHPRNPVTGGDAWDVSDKTVVASVLPGGAKHAEFLGWLDMVAEFMNSLVAPGDEKIAIIFRPWHEHIGSWFWWGQDLCSTEEYIALWRMTIDHLWSRDVRNMLIAYSPNLVLEEESYMERYPGDEYVQILGVDAYHGGGERNADSFRERLSSGLEMMSRVAKQKSKLIAVTETGSEGLPMSNWWTDVLMEAVSPHPVTYVFVWRNAHTDSKENHFYAPYPGQASAEDFIRFYNLPQTLFAKDIAK